MELTRTTVPVWLLSGKWGYTDDQTSILDNNFIVSPIPSNHDFTYEYPVTQAGTFWLHSHFKVTRP